MLSRVFERFTEDARQVVIHAQDAGRELRHGSIGTEHLLLGLVQDTAQLPWHLLRPLGVDNESVHAKLLEIVGHGDHTTAGQIPFTPRAKKVLELALRETLSLGHNEIRSGHVLLGLLREGDGVGVRILLDLGVSTADLREQVVKRLEAPDAAGIRRTRVRTEQAPQLGFVARPDAELRALLMQAAGRALADARETVTVADLLAVITPPDEQS
jgi:ATP-dependent Clp protease ATP-binding subunit ClpC